MNLDQTGWWILFTVLWYIINGILHDVFVIRQHTGGYNRELLRLLMDGHVLILSGVLNAATLFVYGHSIWDAALIFGIVNTAMFIYCWMIFPFLKSIGTTLISGISIVIAIIILSK